MGDEAVRRGDGGLGGGDQRAAEEGAAARAVDAADVAEFAGVAAQLRVKERDKADERVGELETREAGREGGEMRAEGAGELDDAHFALGEDVAAAAGIGGGHGGEVGGGDVADVDEGKGHPRGRGNGAVQQAEHQGAGGAGVVVEQGAEDGGGVDDGEAVAGAEGVGDGPGLAFGPELRFRIGAGAGAVGIGPVGDREGAAVIGMAVDYRGDRGGEDDAFDAGGERGGKGAMRAFDGGADQILAVAGRLDDEGRGDVLEVADAGGRLGPAGVAQQVEGDDLEAGDVGAVGGEGGADPVGAGRGADRAADDIAVAEEVEGDMAAEEAGDAGDEDAIGDGGSPWTEPVPSWLRVEGKGVGAANAPSTSLRLVPLPRFAVEEQSRRWWWGEGGLCSGRPLYHASLPYAWSRGRTPETSVACQYQRPRGVRGEACLPSTELKRPSLRPGGVRSGFRGSGRC